MSKEGEFKRQIKLLNDDKKSYWFHWRIGEFGNHTYTTEYALSQDDAYDLVDKAKKDLYSTIHDSCYFYNEAGCAYPNWKIYHKQPEDCPLRRLEKWFGEQE